MKTLNIKSVRHPEKILETWQLDPAENNRAVCTYQADRDILYPSIQGVSPDSDGAEYLRRLEIITNRCTWIYAKVTR